MFLLLGVLCLVILAMYNNSTPAACKAPSMLLPAATKSTQLEAQHLFCSELYPLLSSDMVVGDINGDPIYLYNSSDGISRWLLSGRKHETYEVDQIVWALSELTSPDQQPLYVDVGANVGSVLMQVAQKHPCRIAAFEGMKSNVLLLRNTLCSQLLQHRVHFYAFGLSSQQQVCSIYSQSANRGDGIVACSDAQRSKLLSEGCIKRGELRLERLDSVVQEDIHVLKIDVEGFERFVLAGASSLIRKRLIHFIIMELWASTPLAFLETLQSTRYSISTVGFQGPWVDVANVSRALSTQQVMNVYLKLR